MQSITDTKELITMKIFGKERESLRVKRWRSVRAMYIAEGNPQEIEIQLLTDENQKLTLRVRADLAPELIGQLTDAYEAINVPLHRRRNGQATWEGSENN